MRVAIRPSLSFVGQQPAAVDPAKEAGILEVKLLQLTAALNDRTAEEAIIELASVQNSAQALERAPLPKPVRQKLHGIRFGASKAAANLWRSLTPEGRERTREATKKIIDRTPPLKSAVEKDDRGERVGIKYDEVSNRFILPNGKVAPGKRLGQEKERLGWKDADHARRMEILRQLRAKGGHLKASEVRDALDQGKPLSEEKIRAKLPPPARAPEAPKGKPMGRLGYFGQADSALESYLSEAQDRFQKGSLEEQAAILDKVSDIGSAMNASEAGTMTNEDVAKVIGTPEEVSGAEFPLVPVLLGVGGVVIVGLILYFAFKK